MKFVLLVKQFISDWKVVYEKGELGSIAEIHNSTKVWIAHTDYTIPDINLPEPIFKATSLV